MAVFVAVTGTTAQQSVPPSVDPGRLQQQFQPQPSPPRLRIPLIIQEPAPENPPEADHNVDTGQAPTRPVDNSN